MDMAMVMDTIEDMATTMARGRLRLLPLQNQDIMVGMVMDTVMVMAMDMDTMEDMATTMERGRLKLLQLRNQDIMVGMVMDTVMVMAMDMDMDMAMVGMVIKDTMVKGLLLLSLDIMVDMVMVMDMATDMAMVMVMDTMVKQQLLYYFISKTSVYGTLVLSDLVMRNIT